MKVHGLMQQKKIKRGKFVYLDLWPSHNEATLQGEKLNNK